MSKTYEVIRADHKKNFPKKDGSGEMAVYTVELREDSDGSGNSYTCEMFQQPTTAPLKPGETVKGDITPNRNPEYPPKFKKAYEGGGGFSGGGSKGGGTYKPRDPSEIAGARHAHNLLVAAHSFVPLPIGATGSEVQGRIDELEAFACVLDEKTKAISDFASQEKNKSNDDVPF